MVMMDIERLERVELFENELRLQIENPAGGDKRTSAYCEASRQLLQDDSDYQKIANTVLFEREGVQPSHAVNLVLRALQKQLTKNPDSGYPEVYTHSDPWKEALKYATYEGSSVYDEFITDIRTRNVQSNVSERYKAVAMVVNLMQDFYGKRPSILDVGCSRNHGLKRLTMGKKFRFSQVNIEESVVDHPAEPIKAIPDGLATCFVQELLRTGLRLGPSLGIDIVPIQVEDNKEWARSCSFYPSELLDRKKVKAYDELDEAERQNVAFYHGDFSNLDVGDLERHSRVERFDIVTFSTVLYQVSPEKHETMFENAKKLLKPNGIILIQDFAEVDPDNNYKLRFFKNWFKEPYLYRTILLDPKIRDGSLIELFRWDNGRCNKLLLSNQRQVELS
ncbi:hypothetical protein BH23PAT2_BH23PAT2_02100 [soil metagenome]